MNTRYPTRALSLVACLCAFSLSLADDWPEPSEQIKESANQQYKVLFQPSGYRRKGPCKLQLERDGAQVYARDAVNGIGAVDLFVSDAGQVVSLDEWDCAGYDHALVIYDPEGHVVIDKNLEELLTPEEFLGKIEWSTSSRWWHDKVPDNPFVGDYIEIPTSCCGAVRFRLSDGQQEREGQPFSVPTRGERFVQSVARPQDFSSWHIEYHEVEYADGHAKGGIVCEIEETISTCRTWSDEKTYQETYTHEQAAFHEAIRSLATLQPHIIGQCAGHNLPETHTLINVRFGPSSRKNRFNGYEYTILAPTGVLRSDPKISESLDKLRGLPHLDK